MFNMFGAKPFGTPFAASTSFTQTATSGTTVKFNPPNGQDTIVKNGVTTNINTKHQCITAMKEYENKSIEGGLFGTNPVTTQSSLFGTGTGTSFGTTSTFLSTVFGTSQQQSTGLFAQKLPAFGTSTAGSTGFGFNAGSSQGSSNLFAKSLPNSTFTGFNTASTATMGFGTSGGGLFNTSKPGTFGFNTTTSAPSFGFGAGLNTGANLFGNAQNKSAFGNLGTTTGNTGGNTGTFTAKTTGTSAGFATPGFGSNTPAPTGGLFGQNTSLSTATGVFRGGQPTTTSGGNQNTSSGGNTSTYKAKTTGTSAGFATPGFGSNTTAPTGSLFGQNTSLSTAKGVFRGGQPTTTSGGNQNSSFAFGSTPSASGGLFGQNNQSTGTGLFATPVSNTAFGAKTPGFSGGNTGTFTAKTTGTSAGFATPGFGSNTPAPTGGLFGQNTSLSTATGVFRGGQPTTTSGGNQNTSSGNTGTFTAKTTGTSAGFATPGFGSNTPAPTGGLFGQNTSLSTATGLFGGGQPTTTSGGNQNTSFESTTKEIKPKCMDVGSQTNFGESTIAESKPKCMDVGSQTDFGESTVAESKLKCMDAGSQTDFGYFARELIDQFKSENPDYIQDKGHMIFSGIPSMDGTLHPSKQLVMPSSFEAYEVCTHSFASLSVMPSNSSKDSQGRTENTANVANITAAQFGRKTLDAFPKATTQEGVAAGKIPSFTPTVTTQWIFSKTATSSGLPTALGGLPTATTSLSGGTITNLSRLSIFGSLPITTAPGGLPTNTSVLSTVITSRLHNIAKPHVLLPFVTSSSSAGAPLSELQTATMPVVLPTTGIPDHIRKLPDISSQISQQIESLNRISTTVNNTGFNALVESSISSDRNGQNNSSTLSVFKFTAEPKSSIQNRKKNYRQIKKAVRKIRI